MALTNGGHVLNWFLMALASWQKGEKDKARSWFDKAAQAARTTEKHPNDAELRKSGPKRPSNSADRNRVLPASSQSRLPRRVNHVESGSTTTSQVPATARIPTGTNDSGIIAERTSRQP